MAKQNDGPTKQSVEKLLRELDSRWGGPLWMRVRKLEKEYAEEQDRLIASSPKLKALAAEVEKAQKKADKQLEEVSVVRHLFLAEGLTDKVLKRVSKLVEEQEKLASE